MTTAIATIHGPAPWPTARSWAWPSQASLNLLTLIHLLYSQMRGGGGSPDGQVRPALGPMARAGQGARAPGSQGDPPAAWRRLTMRRPARSRRRPPGGLAIATQLAVQPAVLPLAWQGGGLRLTERNSFQVVGLDSGGAGVRVPRGMCRQWSARPDRSRILHEPSAAWPDCERHPRPCPIRLCRAADTAENQDPEPRAASHTEPFQN